MSLEEERKTQFIKLRTISHFKYKLLEQENKIHPRYNSKDVTDEQRFSSLSEKDSDLVAFNITISHTQPQEHRVFNRYSRFTRLSVNAHAILNSKLFNIIINGCIILSIVELLIDADMNLNKDPSKENIRKGIQAGKLCILCILFLEIVLKWLDDFRMFWESKWNMFDLIITVLTAVPEVLPKTSETAVKSQSWLKLLIQFRTLRFIKIFAKYTEMRLILLSIFRVFQAKILKHRLMLLLLVLYIFAALGVKVFAKYTTSTVPDLQYQGDFKDLPSSLLTLFSIYTMDHCMSLINDIRRVPELNFNACVVFIVFWFFIGAITLSNFIVDVIVYSFHHVRTDLSKEVKQIKIQQRAEEFDYLNRANVLVVEEPSDSSEKTELHWEKLWNEYFQAKEYHGNDATRWYEDTLFRFFRLQERLHHNLQVQKKLQDIAVQAILNTHDC